MRHHAVRVWTTCDTSSCCVCVFSGGFSGGLLIRKNVAVYGS